VSDDDSIVFFSTPDELSYYYTFFGEFSPKAGQTTTFPYVLMGTGVGTAIPITRGSTLGLTTGVSPTNGGGVVVNGSVRSLAVDRLQFPLENSANTPANRVYGTPTWDEYPIPIFAFEVPNHIGYLGQISFIQEVGQVPHGTLNGNGTKVVIGGPSSSLSTARVTIPWGNVPFGSGYQRSGFVF
jgi:hypothetical protein